MRKNKIFREWLRKAEEDFGFANASLKETKYYSQFIGFPQSIILHKLLKQPLIPQPTIAN